MNLTLINANIKKLFYLRFFQSLILAYVVERVFAEARGLTPLQMQYIIILFSIISFVLEVPSGALADKWKKKYVLALGQAFCFFEFFISIFAYDFPTFCLAFIFAAIGCSLQSGVVDSILYESLQATGRTAEFEKLKGYLKMMDYTVVGVLGLLGGYIAHRYGMVTNYWLSLFGTPIAIAFCLSIHEPKKATATSEIHLVQHIFESLQIIVRNKSLRSVFIYSGLTGAILYEELYEMSSLTYAKLGIPLYLFGYIGLVMLALGGLGAVFAERVKRYFTYSGIFKTVLILSGVSLYFFSVIHQWWGLFFLIVAILLLEMVTPLLAGYIHHNIADKYRTTISSTESFTINGFTVLVGLMFGYFADHFSIFGGFKSLALLLGVYAVFYLPSVLPEKPGKPAEEYGE